jgi:hypothetical protein
VLPELPLLLLVVVPDVVDAVAPPAPDVLDVCVPVDSLPLPQWTESEASPGIKTVSTPKRVLCFTTSRLSLLRMRTADGSDESRPDH